MAEIEIDGSFGEGGGQILRTALSLSLLTGKSLRIYNLRAKRAKPGLRAQHLCAVDSAVKISQSQVQGAEIGSKEILFFPEPVRAGKYQINIGTAGSTSLVFQTLLPALLFQDQPSELQIIGGTHNPKSPSFDFIKDCFLELLKKLGIKVEAKILRYGFYPRGGGEVIYKIYLWKKSATYLKLTELVEWKNLTGEILLAGLPGHIAERERAELEKRLGLSSEQIKTNFLPSDQGPGNAIILRCFSQERVEVFTGYGEPGKRAERVAGELARMVKNFLKSQAQVDLYLADQILLYLALGKGGEFTTSFLSSHFHTNLKIIQKFLEIEAQIYSLAPDRWLVKIIPKNLK